MVDSKPMVVEACGFCPRAPWKSFLMACEAPQVGHSLTLTCSPLRIRCLCSPLGANARVLEGQGAGAGWKTMQNPTTLFFPYERIA